MNKPTVTVAIHRRRRLSCSKASSISNNAEFDSVESAAGGLDCGGVPGEGSSDLESESTSWLDVATHGRDSGAAALVSVSPGSASLEEMLWEDSA
jgi:hypothetical protein